MTIAQSHLNEKEQEIYKKAVEEGEPLLSLKPSSDLYNLFVQGIPISEIHKVNQNFSIGTIMRTRVEHEWDRRRSEYLDILYNGINEKVSQTQAETVSFTTDVLAAYHKMMGTKIKKYLQSGDEAELGPFQLMSIKNYKDLVEIMLKTTGQNNSKQVKVTHEHELKPDHPTIDVTPSVKKNKPIDSMEAFDLLKKIANGEAIEGKGEGEGNE